MAIKKFPHAVIYDGVFYPSNTEITVKEVKEEVKETISEKETVAEEKPKKRGAK